MTTPALPRPAGVKPAIPAEFINPETGEADVEALLAAFMALQQHAEGAVSVPGPDTDDLTRRAFFSALGVPDSPDGYQVAAPHALLQADPAVNSRLHAAGFTPEQVQVVYDLAAEHVIPVLETMAADMDGDRELARLIDHFGGEERWAEISRQLQAWGKANLPADVLSALAGTADGVLALFRMMQSGEPGLGGLDKSTGGPTDEDAVKALMRDPKYWRERDPATVRKVAEGFKRLYPGA